MKKRAFKLAKIFLQEGKLMDLNVLLSHISGDNAILNKLKSTQSKDCLILKLFRMTDEGKKMSTAKANDKAQSNIKNLFTYSLINLFTPKNTTYRPNVLTTITAPHTLFSRFQHRFNLKTDLSLKGRGGSNKNVKDLFTYSPINLFTNNKTVSAHSPFTTHHSQNKRAAFTLAEVLITLGIIGVVAAMTMPTLIQKHRKSVVETGLKKFYTTMNQAIQLSVNDNGETKYWEFFTGSEAYTPEANKQFYNKYFKKYLKTLKTDIISLKGSTSIQEYFGIFFADGSAVAIGYGGHDWSYCTKATDFLQFIDKNGTGCFWFGFYPTTQRNDSPYTTKVYYNKGIEPYVQSAQIQVGTDENGNPIYEAPSEDNLYEGKFYARAIQINGWRIPDDYPLKF